MKRHLVLREPGPRLAEVLTLGARVATAVFLLTAVCMAVGAAITDRGTWGREVLGVCAAGIWAANVLEALPRWRTTFVYLMFHLTLFLFVVANPLIDLAYDSVNLHFSETTGAPTILWCLILSLLSLRAGAWFVTRRLAARDREHPEPDVPRAPRRLARLLILAMTLVAVLCALASSLEAWLYVRSHSYSAYFTSYSTHMPTPLVLLTASAPAFLACYLATFPRSRIWLAVLALHVASTLPLLAMGMRGPTMRALALVVTYGFIRWRIFGRSRSFRIPLVAVLCAVALLPVGMAGLGELKYQRVGEERASQMDPVTDFVWSQSITFSVASRGIFVQDQLPGPKPSCFTVGNVVDYLAYGAPGQMFLGNEPLGGNSVRHAEHGHEFAHSFSYKAYREQYLRGVGAGSSYLIENYLDGGFPLVVLYSLLLGALLVLLGAGHSHRWLPSALLLMALSGVFTLPRDNATAFLTFIVTPPFWLAVVAVGAVLWWDRRQQRVAVTSVAPSAGH